MYGKLAGMTGTAETEAGEFWDIYKLDVVVIPTNSPIIRNDQNDRIYKTKREKYTAVIEEISSLISEGRPVLVGTTSVEISELLSRMLTLRKIKHNVLNAKLHQREAEIVATAGQSGVVTIATNMAGRGTDIILGGNPDYAARADMRVEGYSEELIEAAIGHAPTDDEEIINARKRYAELLEMHKKAMQPEHDEVVALGGLHIVGTERHESRRIDNQLRGRSGRQGDPGSSVFFISLEDDLMRLFGGERIQGLMTSVSKDDDMPLAFSLLTKQIEAAQKRIEARNYEIRKNVLQYDDVMNKQREIIYSQRRQVLMGEDVHDHIMNMLDSLIDEIVPVYCPEGVYPEEWDISGMTDYFRRIFLPRDMKLFKEEEIEGLTQQEVKDRIRETARELYRLKEKEIEEGGQNMREIERILLLRAVDTKWMAHIDAMDQLRQGIGLRAFGQRDPIVEYRREGFDMFEEMVRGIQEDTLTMLFHVKLTTKPIHREAPRIVEAPKKALDSSGHKLGRNAPCPCGSGKKYKNCCGKAQQ
jgi:preprotein translocase subunit SecA